MSAKNENLNLLQEAIQLAQTGKKESARNKLLQLIQSEPANQAAWLWLVDTCDTDAERKAILSRGIKLNPQNPVLQQALDRLNKIGAPKARPAMVEQPPASQPITRLDSVLSTEPDLDWLAEVDETELHEDVATISDEEFSTLSRAFFAAKKEQAEEVTTAPEPNPLDDEPELSPEKKARRSFFDFLKREAEENNDAISISTVTEEVETKPKPEYEEKKKNRQKKEDQYQAIEDELKQAFVEAQGTEKVNRLAKKTIPKFMKRVLFYLGIIIAMFLMVLGGLFLIEQYKARKGIRGDLVTALPTVTLTATADAQAIAIQQTLEAAATSTPQSFQDIVSATDDGFMVIEYPILTVSNVTELTLLHAIESSKPISLRDDLRQYVVLAGRQALLYDVDAEQSLLTLSVPDGEVLVAADFSDDGTLLAAVTRSMMVSVWRLPEGTLLREFTAPKTYHETPTDSFDYFPFDGVYQLVISPDNETLVFGFWGVLDVWNIASGDLVYTDESLDFEEFGNLYRNNQNGNFSIAYSADGHLLALGVTSHVAVIDRSGDVQFSTSTAQHATGLYFVDETHLLVIDQATAQSHPGATLWDISTEEAIFAIDLCGVDVCFQNEPSSVALQSSLYSPNGESFVVENDFGLGREIRHFDLNTGKIFDQHFTQSSHPVYSMAVSPAGDLLVYTRLNQTESLRGKSEVMFWDNENSEEIFVCEDCLMPFGVEPRSGAIIFSDDGSRMAICSQGYGCRIFITTAP